MKMLNTKEIDEYFSGEPPVLSASLRTTKSCNLKCKHCYANAGKCLVDELKIHEIDKMLDGLNDLGVMSVFYTGGEPFLRRDINKILKLTSDKDMDILVSTNGTIVSDEQMKQISRKHVKLFQVSLDSPKSEVHDALRGLPNTYAKALDTIRRASKIFNKNVGIGTVLMKNNWRDMHKILEIGIEHGADTFALITLLKMGRAEQKMDPTIQQKYESIMKMFDTYRKHKNKLKFANNTTLPPALIPKDLRETLWDKFCFCSFPYTLGVESNGDVAPCDGFLSLEPEHIIGNIRKNNIKDIWNQSKLIRHLKKIGPDDLKGICGKCKYNNYCMGGCRAAAWIEYKDFKGPEPLCQRAYESGLFPRELIK